MVKHKGNILTLLLIAITIIALSAAGYFFLQNQQLQKTQLQPVVSQPTQAVTSTIPTEEANWKTYSNSIYGYSIKYPSNLGLIVTEKNDREVFIMKPQSDYGLVITVYDNPQELAPSFWIRSNLQSLYGETIVNGRKVTSNDLYISHEGNASTKVQIADLPPYFLLGHPYIPEIYKIDGHTLDTNLFEHIFSTMRLRAP